jgi:type I restriction enzyme S subunit
MIWDSITVDEIKAKKKYSLVGGPFGSDLSGIHYVEFGVPVIRGTNLPFNQKFSSEDFVYVSEEKANKLSSNTAHAGDLIFTQRGTLGQVGIVPEAEFERYIISQSQMKLTIDISKADPLYVYYYFRTKECNYRIENLALSSGVPHINLGILKKFKIPYPPLPIQRKIASILSAYDELIENNTQRIKLLEEMSEEIYKEWFVRLRFPGYESTNFFDADCNEVAHDTLGALPEDWEKIKLRNCFSKYIGGGWGEETPKGKNSEPAYVIRGTDIPNARILMYYVIILNQIYQVDY